MDDRTASAIFYALVLMLPLSALLARRMPLGRVAKMAAAWIGIFLVALLGVAVVREHDGIGGSMRRLLYGPDQSTNGAETRVPMADDGHFWVTARINGVERRMLVDSGASDTALSRTTAQAANVPVGDVIAQIDTANGEIIAHPVTIDALQIGAITARRVPAVTADAFGDTDVLGMSFLSRLASWKVEGRTLVLTPGDD